MTATQVAPDGRRSALRPLIEEPEPETTIDWLHVGLFGAGIALGAILGGAITLLAAPAVRDGRISLPGRARGSSVPDSVWDDLGREMESAARDLDRVTRDELP